LEQAAQAELTVGEMRLNFPWTAAGTGPRAILYLTIAQVSWLHASLILIKRKKPN